MENQKRETKQNNELLVSNHFPCNINDDIIVDTYNINPNNNDYREFNIKQLYFKLNVYYIFNIDLV